MTVANIKHDTWHEVLMKNGFEPEKAKCLIGFISWNKGDEFPYLGREITDVLSGYEGRVFAKDTVSSEYGDKALMFFSQDITGSTANRMFDVIMNYEQNHVYTPEEVVHGMQ